MTVTVMSEVVSIKSRVEVLLEAVSVRSVVTVLSVLFFQSGQGQFQ